MFYGYKRKEKIEEKENPTCERMQEKPISATTPFLFFPYIVFFPPFVFRGFLCAGLLLLFAVQRHQTHSGDLDDLEPNA